MAVVYSAAYQYSDEFSTNIKTYPDGWIDFQVQETTDITATGATINWSFTGNTAEIDSYRLRCFSPFFTINVADVEATSQGVTGLTPDSDVQVIVQARKDNAYVNAGAGTTANFHTLT